jgi:quercetin dioxygenase-like cupin family protein
MEEEDMFARRMDSSNEPQNLPETRIEVVKVGDSTIMRGSLEPGWRWSEWVKPTVGTEGSQVPHVSYVLSGRMMVTMEDGTSKEVGCGESAVIPPGHDAWVLGNEPCVIIDFAAG